MNKKGPIIIIVDDVDDHEILVDIFKHLNYKNKIIFFTDGFSVLDYLNNSGDNPFLIISDIFLPKLDGFQLRDKIKNNTDLSLKCIPYLFFTSAGSQAGVMKAYSQSVQGFFIKPNNLIQYELIIKKIIEYWKECATPTLF